MFMLGLVGINQFLLSFILYLRSNVSGLLMFKTDSILSVLDRFLMIIICGILLYTNVTGHEFRISWFVYAQTTAYFIAAMIAFIIVVLHAKFRKLHWNWPFFLVILKQSFPFAILFLLMTFYNRIDSVMLERILPENIGEQQSGIYAMAYRLLDSMNQVPYLFSVLLFPIFARMIKEKQNVEEMVKLSFSLLFIISIVVAAGSYFYNFRIIDALYIEHVDASAKVFSILMLCLIPVSTIYIFGTLLTANGNLMALNLIAGIGMLLNVLLNFILIPKFEALGSAIASISTQFLSGILQVIIVQKVFRFRVNTKYLLSLVSFIAGVIAFNIMTMNFKLPWTFNFGIMIILSLVLAVSLRLFNIKSILLVMMNSKE